MSTVTVFLSCFLKKIPKSSRKFMRMGNRKAMMTAMTTAKRHQNYINEQQAEWIETGCDEAISDFIKKIRYSDLIRLQEKTQYQICFGGEVNVEEMVKAIKVLIEK